MHRTTCLALFICVALISVHASDSRFLSSVPEVTIPEMEDNACIKQSTDPEGFDYGSLSLSERTQRFIDGPCSPMILIPGVEGTRLQVNIDCETLQQESPKAFSACGWNTCDAPPSWEVWKFKPDAQYNIWVPEPFTPMDIIANVVHPDCWGQLFSMTYDASEPEFANRLKNPPGVTVQWYEQGTENQACGLNAISTLLPSSLFSYFKEDFSYFQNMINSLQRLGYITGVSLFATPYDWRRSPASDETHYSITGTAELIKKLTGKKAVLLSHSLGNMQVLYTLNRMDQADKDNLIAHYVAVMPPYLGAPRAAGMFLGSNDFDPYHLGIPTQAIRSMSATCSSLYNTIPKATYETQANEPYMKDLFTRLNAESEHDPSTKEGEAWWAENAESLPYQWFPTPNETCSNGNLTERDDPHCVMGIRDWASDVLIQVEEKTFKATTADMNEFVSSGIAGWMPEERNEIFDGVMVNEIGELLNPNVEITTIYGALMNTTHSIHYDYNPLEKVAKDESAPPSSSTYELGDGVVPVSSSLLASMKWGWEYEHRTSSTSSNPSAKPVHLLEWCSTYENGTLEFNKQETTYSGLWCQCLASSQDGSKCDHMKSVTDPNLINWLGHFATSLENSVESQGDVKPTGLTMSESELQTLATTCPSLNNLPGNMDKEQDVNVDMEMFIN